MPLYEYACEHCGDEVTRLVQRGEDVPRRCPRCGGEALRRVASRFHAPGGRGPDPRLLRADPRTFRERPERFGEAMRALSERTGVRFDSERTEEAMHRLSETNREA